MLNVPGDRGSTIKLEHFIEGLAGNILGGREEGQYIQKILQRSWPEYIFSVTGMSLISNFSL